MGGWPGSVENVVTNAIADDLNHILELTEAILRLTDGKLALADKDAQVIAKDGAGIRVFLSERPDERLPIGERLDPDALAGPLNGAKLA